MTGSIPLPDVSADVPVGPRLHALLSLCYRARRAALLEGPTGVGKSEVVRDVARSLGVGLVVLDLSLLEPPDLVGLPVIADGRTRFAAPDLLPSEGAGILLLEELNRAEPYVRQPALQLLTARRLHAYELPPDWVCMAAVNPVSSDYQVTPLDRALRSRFLHVTVRTDRLAWLAWATSHGVHPGVIDLVRMNEPALEDVPPRTWVYVSGLLHALTPADLQDAELLRDALTGYLPEAWAELLLRHRDRWQDPDPVDVDGLLAGGDPARAALATVATLRREGKTDRVQRVVDRVSACVRGADVTVLADQGRFSLDAFEALLAELPGDAREKLSEQLGANAAVSSMLGIHPMDAVKQWSQFEPAVRGWVKDARQRHRVAWLVAALKAHLLAHGRTDDYRRSNAVRMNLGRILAVLGERHAMPLVQVLLDVGLTPIRPS